VRVKGWGASAKPSGGTRLRRTTCGAASFRYGRTSWSGVLRNGDGGGWPSAREGEEFGAPHKTEWWGSVLRNDMRGEGFISMGVDPWSGVWWSGDVGGGWPSAREGGGRFGSLTQNRVVGLGFDERRAGEGFISMGVDTWSGVWWNGDVGGSWPSAREGGRRFGSLTQNRAVGLGFDERRAGEASFRWGRTPWSGV